MSAAYTIIVQDFQFSTVCTVQESYILIDFKSQICNFCACKIELHIIEKSFPLTNRFTQFVNGPENSLAFFPIKVCDILYHAMSRFAMLHCY